MREELSEDASAASEGHMHMHAGMGGSGTILGGKDDAGGHSDPKAAWTQSKRRAGTLLFVQRGPAGRGLAGLALLPSQLL